MKKLLKMLNYLYQSTLIPYYVFESKKLIATFPLNQSITLPPSPYLMEMLHSTETISYLSTSFYAYFGFLKVNRASDIIIIVGPSSQIQFLDDTLWKMRKQYAVPTSHEEAFDNFFKVIPPMPFHQFLNHLLTLHFLINDKELTYTDLLKDYAEQGEINIQHVHQHFESKEKNYFNNSYEIENTMLRFVELGNQEGLLQFLQSAFSIHEGVLATDHIRQSKNMAIVIITLITRAAIRGGLNSEVAFQLSDIYIQQIEKLTSLEAIQSLNHEAFMNFTQKVADSKTYHIDQTEMKSVIHYIIRNTNKNLSVQQLADVFGYNRSYLSSKFKRELGVNLNQFITRCKLEESKLLLSTTDKSISNISNYLCFSSQSHFQTVFKKVYGQTPTNYRKQKTEI